MTRDAWPADRERAMVRRANHRVVFLGHAVIWLTVGVLLSSTAGFRATSIVLLSWGVLLAAHGFFAVLAPNLRDRWVAEEQARLPSEPAHLSTQAPGRRDPRALEALAAAIAHEIRNPITAAKSLVQQMRDDPAAADLPELAAVAIEELDRVERSVSHLLRYAKEEPLEIETVDLAGVASAAIDSLEQRGLPRHVQIERALDADITLEGDADKLRRVVLNLVQNAVDAVAERPDSTSPGVIRVGAGRDFAGRTAWLRVEDNGVGVDPARSSSIFAPFETSKETGTGLGLAIAKKLVESHGGTLELEEVKVGAAFTARLPLKARAVTGEGSD